MSELRLLVDGITARSALQSSDVEQISTRISGHHGETLLMQLLG